MLSLRNHSLESVYGRQFYDAQRGGSLQSARVILPRVRDIVRPTSVVDVGCGVGTWLSVWAEMGVQELLGLDGPWVDGSTLLIPQAQFRQWNLSERVDVGRTFELAMSLEVAEHLDSRYARQFVHSVCKLAPIVLFSAAIPKQGGEHHVNEQWPMYWRDLFAEEGYVTLDPFRAGLLHDDSVDWWYRQNVFLMVRTDLHAQDPRFQALPVYSPNMMIVSAEIFQKFVKPGVRSALHLLPTAVVGTARRRLRQVRSTVRRFTS
jgi:hypothetical protein